MTDIDKVYFFAYIMAIVLAVVLLVAVGIYSSMALISDTTQETRKDCYRFMDLGFTTMRQNLCTGEAHMVVESPSGFMWQRVIDAD